MVSNSRERGSFGCKTGFQSLSDAVSLNLKNRIKVSGKRFLGCKRGFQRLQGTGSLGLKNDFEVSVKRFLWF